MKIERLLKKREDRVAFVKEMMGTNVLAVLHYLTEGEKKEAGMVEMLPELDFSRAVVARVEVTGEEKIQIFRNFLAGFVTVNRGGFEGDKSFRILSAERVITGGKSEFFIIFVNQVFAGKLTRHNVSYLLDSEIDAWEEALASYLRHHMGGVTVIR